jgi:hypothetical protein
MKTKHITINTVREAYTSEGLTFELSKRVDEWKADVEFKWHLSIKWADGSDALDGYTIQIGDTDIEALAELFTIQGAKK